VFARGGGTLQGKGRVFLQRRGEERYLSHKKKQYQISTTTNTAFTTLSPYNSQPETPRSGDYK
jgi:hypothetical protein